MAKRNLQNLKLRAIAAVDRPCQEHAKVFAIKRAPDETDREEAIEFLAKWVGEGDGAHTFREVLRVNQFSEKIWPCVDAFTQSIRSIVGDASLTGAARAEKISASTGEFLAAVTEIAPDVSKRLEPLVRKDETMPKTVEELQADLNKVNGELTSATALVASEKARADAAEAALATANTELAAAKAEGGELATVKAELATVKAELVKATDETVTAGGQTIRKSEVGAAQFSVVKALADDREIAQLEKRANTEFRHVVGNETEKALVLKHIGSLPEASETRKAFEAILNSAEKMAAQGFKNLGRSDGQLSETGKAAVQKFEQKVDAVANADKCSRMEAMAKVRREEPALFAEYQEANG
jgi:hypothetical protein